MITLDSVTFELHQDAPNSKQQLQITIENTGSGIHTKISTRDWYLLGIDELEKLASKAQSLVNDYFNSLRK